MIIGAIEMAIAILIALVPVSYCLCRGSAGAVVMFLTVSFIIDSGWEPSLEGFLPIWDVGEF